MGAQDGLSFFKGSVSVASLRDRRVRCRVVTVWAAAPVHLSSWSGEAQLMCLDFSLVPCPRSLLVLAQADSTSQVGLFASAIPVTVALG